MIKIDEQKILLFTEIIRVSNWSEEEVYDKVSQPLIENCELNILELLEFPSGRLLVIKLIRNWTKDKDLLE